MTAASILALAIATSITVMQRGFHALDAARHVTLAAQIMQSEIEKTRLKDWATVSAYAPGPTPITIDSVFTENSGIGSRFTLQRSVSTPQTDMREIKLTISWRSLDGREQSRSMMTYYSRYGLYDFYYNGLP